MGERSEVEKVLVVVLAEASTWGGRPLGALAQPWPGEELPGKPGEPVLRVFRPPPGVQLHLRLDG